MITNDWKFIHLSQWIHKLFDSGVLLKRACEGHYYFRNTSRIAPQTECQRQHKIDH